uniref:Uncharacterized protein n=1 Tax=Gouania willdenowi TaxID=441366 RepID=A0A8C5DYW6_GOUWI
TDGCAPQEALTVVSDDQPIFEPSYAPGPSLHMKAEMTTPGGFSAKQSPEAPDNEWAGPTAQNSGKRGEHMNGTK